MFLKVYIPANIVSWLDETIWCLIIDQDALFYDESGLAILM